MLRRAPRLRHVLAGLVLVVSFGRPPSSSAQDVPVQEFRLDNGMRFLLVPRAGEPTIACGWIAKVGSVNERPGITGTAHLFEHMMFKGTRTIGTRDIDRDLAIMGELDRVKAELVEEQAKLELAHRLGEIEDPDDPSVRSERHAALRAEFDALLAEQKQIIVKDEFDRVYSAQGASGMNAGTTYDFTVYFITVPKNKLELWYWMESDRLSNPVFREFYSERDVVREERRLRTESTPTGIYEEQFESLFWTSSPYGWPVIGWPSDVEAITREEALAFFGLYYAPNNLTACIVGDFDVETAKRWATKYFGRLRPSDRRPPPVRTREVPQVSEKRMLAEAPTRPSVTIRYHTVPNGHRDEPALDVLSDILSGRTGRLYKDLVVEQKIANAASGSQQSRKYDGFFELEGIAADDSSPADVERAIDALIDSLRKEPVTERELQKVKNRVAAEQFRKLRSSFGLLLELLIRDAYLSWETINTDPPKLQAVTAEDLQRVIETYFRPENRTILVLETKGGDEANEETLPPEVAALSPEEQDAYRRTVEQIARLPREAIEANVARLRQNAGQVPPQSRPLFDAILKAAEARLAELDAAPESAEEGGSK